MPAHASVARAPDFSSIPAEFRAAFEHALALRAAVTAAERVAKSTDADALRAARAAADRATRQAMAAVGLAHFEPKAGPDGVFVNFHERPVLRAEALTATQRQVLSALVDQTALFGDDYPIPGTARCRRQWLGLVPPGPLWQPGADGAPRYFEFRRRVAADKQTFETWLAGLPVIERVPLLYELDPVKGDIWADYEPLIGAVVKSLTRDLGPWALAAAEHELSVLGQSKSPTFDNPRIQLVFAALVAAKVPIEPRFDPLLRLDRYQPARLNKAWIAAIAEPRREAAVMAALRAVRFVSDALWLVGDLLPHWPLAAVALYAQANIKDSSQPQELRQTLKAVAAAHPHIKKALADWKKSQPKPLKLKIVSSAKLADLLPLGPEQAAQLEAAACDYNGVVCSAEDLIAGRSAADEVILPETIEYIRLAGPGGLPAFDLWAMMADSGTFFRDGTTEVVGGISQFDVDCADPVLAAALQLALKGR